MARVGHSPGRWPLEVPSGGGDAVPILLPRTPQLRVQARTGAHARVKGVIQASPRP